jgi:hypothetical protein
MRLISSKVYLVVLGLPSQLNHLLVPGLPVEAGSLVGVGDNYGRLLGGQPDEGHEAAVDVLVVGERAEALAVLGAVFAPEIWLCVLMCPYILKQY